MRRWMVWVVALVAGAVATPGLAAVDLLERLAEKGISTEEERQELAKQEQVKETHKNSFSWMTKDGKFSLQLYGYGQVRYTYDDKDNDESRSNFSVQRARVGVRGNAFLKELKYQLYLNAYSGNEKDVSLFDYFLDYVRRPKFGIKAEQYKVPYGVQWNISASALQFVERTTVDGNFRMDSDTGVSLHGKLFSMLSYDLGIFNGEGTNKTIPTPTMSTRGAFASNPLGNILSTSPTTRSRQTS